MVQSQLDSELLDVLLDFGEAMMDSGAEIARVEDSLARMGHSYGAENTNVFVITSSIELTVRFHDGETLTRTRRIHSTGNNDFRKLAKLNALSRKCAVHTIPLGELQSELKQIRDQKIHCFRSYLGSLLAAAGFSVFFGGTLLDGVISGLAGLLICFMQLNAAKIMPNKVFFLFVCSFVMGSGICLTNLLIPGLHIDKIIIGDIMLLIPGIAITTAVRDTLIGDTISGITRLADCLVWAAALAAGIMSVISLFAR